MLRMLNPSVKHYFINRHWSKQFFFRLSWWLWLSLLLMKVSMKMYEGDCSWVGGAYLPGKWVEHNSAYFLRHMIWFHILMFHFRIYLSASSHDCFHLDIVRKMKRACFRITFVSTQVFCCFSFHEPRRCRLSVPLGCGEPGNAPAAARPTCSEHLRLGRVEFFREDLFADCITLYGLYQ